MQLYEGAVTQMATRWAAMFQDDLRLFDRSAKPAFIGGLIDEHVMRWESAGGDNRPA